MSRTPVVLSASWLLALPSLAALALAIFVAHWILQPADLNLTAIVGSLAFLAYSQGARWTLTSHHRRGMRLVRAGRFAEAVPHFAASYESLSRRQWIDRWRSIVLMSASAISYREMALCNVAFCLAQAGDGAGARRAYERALAEFPNSTLARAALNLMRAGQDDRAE